MSLLTMCGHLYIKKSKFNCKPIKIFVRDLLSQRKKYNYMLLFHLFPLSKYFFCCCCHLFIGSGEQWGWDQLTKLQLTADLLFL